jgi:predicted AAA+ superfamily ATPase
MERVYKTVLQEHLKNYDQMLFLVGPRQVGKTTVAKSLTSECTNFSYFNWDNFDTRKLILEGQNKVASVAGIEEVRLGTSIVVFDEIHKYSKWKTFLKGFYDEFKGLCKIVVTGSSSLDAYRKGGDSMMGRYFLYHMYPLTIGELARQDGIDKVVHAPKDVSVENIEALWTHSGFPDPFLKRNLAFTSRWKTLRTKQLFMHDVRDLSKIQEIGQMEVMAEMMQLQIGQLFTKSELAQKINVSASTISRWVKTLQALLYCFEVKPWQKNVRRSLTKEGKMYLYDWAIIDDVGARAENFVAVHLQKFVQFYNDLGMGDYKLCYLRDKEKREVDFIVIRNGKPWFLVEVKHSLKAGLSSNLYYYQEQTGAKHAFQVAFDLPYVDKDCFEYSKPIIVPASTFLSQLV